MSAIESLSGEPQLEFNDEQLDGVYEWHMSQASQAFGVLNPLYMIKGCVHIIGAGLSCFPGVSLVVKVVSKIFISEEVTSRYLLFLQRNEFEKAYYLARHYHLDLSLADDKGRTLADKLLDNIPLPVSKLDLLRWVILKGGAIDLNHPHLITLIHHYLNHNDYALCAELVGRGFSSPKLYSETTWLVLNKLHRKTELPPIQVGPLQPYVKDLTEEALFSKYDYVQPRFLETKQLAQIFTLKEKNFPLIYSKKGIGKTILVEGLAKQIASEEAPDFLVNKRLLTLDWRKLISDINNGKMTFESLHQVLKHLNGKTIIFLDNLESSDVEGLSAVFNKENTTLKNLLENLMNHQGIHWITACKETRLKSLQENPYIEFFFSPYELEEPGKEACFQMMKGMSKAIELRYGIQVEPQCLQSLIEQSKRYLPDANYPNSPAEVLTRSAVLVMSQANYGPLKIQRLEEELSKLTNERLFLESSLEQSSQKKLEAVIKKMTQIQQEIQKLNENLTFEKQILDEKASIGIQLRFLIKLLEKLTSERLIQSLSEKKLALEKKEKNLNELLASTQQVYTRAIDHSVIAHVISDISGIPVTQLTTDEKAMLQNLESSLRKRVKGQEEAIQVVSDTIRRSRLGLNGDNRPRGSFLFLGPTGVGKTELAKALAESLSGDESKMIRIDMSEFQHQVDVNRLIGSAPGYVGYDEKGRLTEALKKSPYTVVLVDELEKAHPAVIDLFLQILDDGRLTDGHGDTVNCKEAVFIMTSNIGADVYSLPKEKQKEALDQALKAELRPEFINRLDEILQFNALDNREVVRKIALLQLENLQEKVEKLFRVSVNWNEDVVQFLVDKGYSPLFGARPLRRLVEKDLMTLISNTLLDGSLQEGQTVSFEVVNDKVVLTLHK
ncbi:MAG: ATP-dependent Clp protease ATP-binding subunit [Chlamydiia bacterium]|nr:ATP-dependent Clp protease ATP-binding subunit [Chlamydiia bacterium]